MNLYFRFNYTHFIQSNGNGDKKIRCEQVQKKKEKAHSKEVPFIKFVFTALNYEYQPSTFFLSVYFYKEKQRRTFSFQLKYKMFYLVVDQRIVE